MGHGRGAAQRCDERLVIAGRSGVLKFDKASSPSAQERRAYLQRVRERGEVVEVMFALRADLLRNLGNMTNRRVEQFVNALLSMFKSVEVLNGAAC